VVGNSGSGKSTLARQLAQALQVPYLELDSVFHQPGWEPLPTPAFQDIVRRRAGEDGWVIDGNYSAVRDIVWARADTVVWLDLPRAVVMRQIIWRTIRRAAVRQELWNGNREPWQNFLSWDPKESVISWAWHKHAEYHSRYAAAAADAGEGHPAFVMVKNRADARRLVASARSQTLV
jgi:adenylate kinase family enzyme